MQLLLNPLFLKNVATAVAYYFAGYFSLMLSTPPSNATAVWPPAGIALALVLLYGYRILPGIFIANFVIAMQLIGISTFATFSLATVFGSQAALGAFFGAWLVHRYCDRQLQLTETRDIITFLFLGGPVAMILPSVITIGSEFVFGFLPPSTVTFSLFTWWVGGSIGVVIFTPFTLLFFAKPRAIWRSRLAPVGIPLALLVFSVFTFFAITKNKEKIYLSGIFQQQVTKTQNAIHEDFANQLENINRLSFLSKFSPSLSQTQIDLFFRQLPHASSTVYGWAPRTKQQVSNPSVDFPDKQHPFTASATPRTQGFHFPIHLKHPEAMATHRSASFFDLRYDASWKAAIDGALQTNKIAYLPKLTINHNNQSHTYSGFAKAIYQNSNTELQGFIVAIQRQDLMMARYQNIAQRNHLFISTLTPDHSVLFPKSFQSIMTMNFSHRSPRFVIQGLPSFIQHFSTNYVWWVFVVGLGITAILGFSLLSLTGRAVTVRRIVEQQKSELHAIYNAYPDLLFLTSETGHVLDFQAGDIDIFSLKRTTGLIGTHIEQIIPSQTVQVIDEAMTTQQVVRLSYAVEGNEKKNFFEARFIPVQNQQLIIVIRDITSLRHAEDEKEKTEMMLRHAQKMEAIGQLTGGISHDFNNILAIIMGSLEILERDLSQHEKYSKWIARALKNTRRGANITKRLLQFSRLRESTSSKPTCLSELFLGLEDLLSKSLTAAIEIKLKIQDKLWSTEIDRGDFEDAIINIALNAKDAMKRGGVLSINIDNISIKDTRDNQKSDIDCGDYVRVSITDNGTGMSRQTLDKVFEPFFTTKPVGEGTGLGLSMVYGFVKRSSGFIHISSKMGYGSTFEIHLPRIDAAVESTDEHTPIARRFPNGKETILVVDDETDLAQASCHLLESLGYTVIIANNGVDAINVLSGPRPIDLIFSDIVMPGELGGIDLARTILNDFQQTQILLTSGYAANAFENSGLGQLKNNLLSKPYTHQDLAKKIRTILDHASVDDTRTQTG